jgi:hypothetical protein
VKSLRAGGLVLATVIALYSAPAAFAQEATTEPTTTETTTAKGDTTSSETDAAPSPEAETARTRHLARRAAWFRLVVRDLSALMQRDRPVAGRSRAEFDTLLDYRIWLRDTWRRHAQRARHRAKNPPHLAAWQCIHRWEGSWRDPDSPYYGGLQMDLAFQRTYGARLLRRKGTADKWAPYEQMWVAERALRAGRGFHPWPIAARRCGLI